MIDDVKTDIASFPRTKKLSGNYGKKRNEGTALLKKFTASIKNVEDVV